MTPRVKSVAMNEMAVVDDSQPSSSAINENLPDVFPYDILSGNQEFCSGNVGEQSVSEIGRNPFVVMKPMVIRDLIYLVAW